MGVVIAKFLLNTEIGLRELPGGLHYYNIYLKGGGRIGNLPIPALFPATVLIIASGIHTGLTGIPTITLRMKMVARSPYVT